MKKIAIVIAFLSLGFAGAQAQNAPKKEIKKAEMMAPASSNATVDAPAEVNASDAAAAVKSEEKKAHCSSEEKKSCGSASGKKSCCSKKAEAKKETPVNP
ncbi:MAG: hypothetical protein ACK5FU_05105 [Bacteroidota bacterium]|jgi:hypothetical protein|nr:hypothetical protein [Sphingobacteriales bacterium]